MSGPNTKRKYESPRQLARQASILTATRELLAEQGYAGTTMRNLADRAGVVPGTLYNLYKSKDDLVQAALAEILDDVSEQAIAQSRPGLDRVRRFAEVTARTLEENPAYAEAMGRALFRGEAEHALTEMLYHRTIRMLVGELAVAQQLGEVLAQIDIACYAKHIAAQNWGVIMSWVMGIFTLDEVSDAYLRAQDMALLSAVCEPLRVRLIDRINT